MTPPLPSEQLVEVDADVADLVEAYLEARRRGLEELQRLVRDEDFAGLRQRGHALAGSGRSYGFEAITRIGGRLEAAAARHDLPAVEAEVEALSGYLTGVRWRVREPVAQRL